MQSFKGKSNLHPAKTPYALKNTFEVRCKDLRGMLCTNKFASGAIEKCIQIGQDWLTPEEFELRAGSKSKKYKDSIRSKKQGITLQEYMENQKSNPLQYLWININSSTIRFVTDPNERKPLKRNGRGSKIKHICGDDHCDHFYVDKICETMEEAQIERLKIDRYCWLDDSKINTKHKGEKGKRYHVQSCTRKKMPPSFIESLGNNYKLITYKEMLTELLNNWPLEEIMAGVEAIGLNEADTWNKIYKKIEESGSDNPKELVKKLEEKLIENWKSCPMTLGIHENCVAPDGSMGFGLTGCNFHNHPMER